MATMLFNSSKYYDVDAAFEPPVTNLWRNHVDRWGDSGDSPFPNVEWDSDTSKYFATDGGIDDMVLSEIWARHSRRAGNPLLTPEVVTLTFSQTRTITTDGSTFTTSITETITTTINLDQDTAPSPANDPVAASAGPVVTVTATVQGTPIIITTTLPASSRDTPQPGLPSQTGGISPGAPTASAGNSPNGIPSAGKSGSSKLVTIIVPTVIAGLTGIVFLIFLTRCLVFRRRRLRTPEAQPESEEAVVDFWDARPHRRGISQGRQVPHAQDRKHPQPIVTSKGTTTRLATTQPGPAASSSDVLSDIAISTRRHQTLKPLPIVPSTPGDSRGSYSLDISSAGVGVSIPTVPTTRSSDRPTSTTGPDGVTSRSVINEFLDSLSPEGREELRRAMATSGMTGSSGWRPPYGIDRVPSLASQGTAPPEYQE